MSYFSENLNPSQLEAVEYCDGPSLVIAGAGSGKTRVLTYKIAYLLQNGFQPWNILALTFTNKAAREMNERIAGIVGTECTRQLWSGTFHSIFARILRRESALIGYRPDFTIYDTADSRSLIKTIIKDMGLDDKVYKPSTIAGRISEAKNCLLLAEEYLADASIHQRDAVSNIPETGRIYAAYQHRCRKANAMDFDDLLLHTYLLFRHSPETQEAYRERFRYILVDEYQDTNSAQHSIISQLTRPDSRICVVGDDAQSIYGFRGAKIDNILQFGTQFPSARIIKLEQNYRSTQNIVNAANSIIGHNKGQIRKQVYSENAEGERIRVLEAYSDKDESMKIAGEIRRLHSIHGIGYEEIALLYRTNAQSRPFEEVFRSLAIPYRIWGGLSFYQRKEIKDVIAYLRLLSNPHDEEAFKRIINYPARGIGNTTLGKLTAAAGEHDTSLWEVLCQPSAHGVKLAAGAANKLNAFRELIESLQQAAHEVGAYELALRTVRASGIGADIHADRSPENLSRQENVQELLDSIKAFEEEMREERGEEHIHISEFLSQVSLLTDSDKQEDDSPKVTLMTVHAAKGLEFGSVFITGMEEDLFPNANARLYPREMEEERRLFYVAVTRAKERCFLSFAKSRYRYGHLEFSAPSPFIDEIDNRYIEREHKGFGAAYAAGRVQKSAPSFRGWDDDADFSGRRGTPDGLYADTRESYAGSYQRHGETSDGPGATGASWRKESPRPTPYPSRTAPYSTRPAQSPTRPASRSAQPSATMVPPPGFTRAASRPASRPAGTLPTLEPGQRIEHERFGLGRVLSVEGKGDSAKAMVEFDNAGTKNLLLKFARFTIL